MIKLIKILKNLLLNQNAKALFYSKKFGLKSTVVSLSKFGFKNKNKTFYVIKRSPGAGLFSNLIFVRGCVETIIGISYFSDKAL